MMLKKFILVGVSIVLLLNAITAFPTDDLNPLTNIGGQDYAVPTTIVPTTTVPTTTDPSSDETTTSAVIASSNELSNGDVEDVILIFASKDKTSTPNSSSDDDSTPKSISKRETGDKPDTDSNDSHSSKEGSTEQPGNGTKPVLDIILIPRPRPILIDIIFFKFNRTSNDIDPDSSSPFGSKGVGHSHLKRINSDEDASSTTTSTPTAPDSDVFTSATTTTSSSATGSNRRRRDTVFSHLTNNSQTNTTTPNSTEDGQDFIISQEVVEIVDFSAPNLNKKNKTSILPGDDIADEVVSYFLKVFGILAGADDKNNSKDSKDHRNLKNNFGTKDSSGSGASEDNDDDGIFTIGSGVTATIRTTTDKTHRLNSLNGTSDSISNQNSTTESSPV